MSYFRRIEPIEKQVKLDAKDFKITDFLVRDARASLSSIAKKAGLSRDAVAYRIARLEKRGIIIGYATFLDYKKLGFDTFRLFMLVSETSQVRRKELIEYLISHPNVARLLEFHDRWDFEVNIIERGLDGFNAFRDELRTKFSDIIMEEEYLVVLQRYTSPYVPIAFYEGDKPTVCEIDIDRTDLAVLKAVGRSVRMPYFTAGQKIGIDADTVRNRIEKMRKCGVIRRRSAVVNISKIGYSFYVFVCSMRLVSAKDRIRLKNIVATTKNVLEINETLGSFDVLAYIAVENQAVLHTIIKELKGRFAPVLKNYLTLVTYTEHCFKPVPDAIFE